MIPCEINCCAGECRQGCRQTRDQGAGELFLPQLRNVTSEASTLRAEAESLRALAVTFRTMGGAFSRSVGAELAVQAADFEAQARIAEIIGASKSATDKTSDQIAGRAA